MRIPYQRTPQLQAFPQETVKVMWSVPFLSVQNRWIKKALNGCSVTTQVVQSGIMCHALSSILWTTDKLGSATWLCPNCEM